MNGEIDRTKLQICLDNHDYQDWWVSVELMKRRVIPADLEFQIIPGRRAGPETLRTLAILSTEFPIGYIVDDLSLARRVLNNFTLANYLTRLDRRMEKVKKAMIDKQVLFRAYNIGWAVFVEQLKLSVAGMILMYPLYQNMGECVTVDELAGFVYPPGTENCAHKIWDHIDELRQKSLPGTKARIETPGLYHHVSGYRLVD